MAAQNLQLRTLRMEDEDAFRHAVREFKAAEPEETFAFQYDESMRFSDYVERLDRWTRGKDLTDGFVPNTFLVAVVGNAIVGRVSIRHSLNDFLERIGGHIGYSVVPSHRRRGYASAMLKEALPIAAALGIHRVLVTCDIDNLASIRVIEKNCGVFEGLADAPELIVPKRRYWIDLSKL